MVCGFLNGYVSVTIGYLYYTPIIYNINNFLKNNRAYTAYSILYTKGCGGLKVEAKDIPIMHKFMPEFWNTIKEFYNVENNDEYFDALHKRFEDLYEIYPDSLARYLSLAFYKWAADVSNGKCKV